MLPMTGDRHGNDDASAETPPGRQVPRLQQDDHGVGADAEVGGVAHRVLAAVPADEVPGLAHDDGEEEEDHDVERVGALHEFRDQEEQHDHDDHQQKVLSPRCWVLNDFIFFNQAKMRI